MESPTFSNLHPPALAQPPRRVVSLVPSITESLFDLGMGEHVVGVSDYCVFPAAGVASLPRLGGPKNPRLAAILALQPDLVLANQEENSQKVVEQLAQAGVPVWVSFPQTVSEALQVLWGLVDLFRSPAAAAQVRQLERSVELVRAAARHTTPVRTFCPIWRDQTAAGLPWWMTFNQQTYCSDLLSLFGCQNVFAERERRFPLEADLGLQPAYLASKGDTRYPRISLAELQAQSPELILLPSEPYAFGEDHRQELCRLLPDAPAVKNDRILLVDGSLITWHGTRIAKTLRHLPSLLDA